MRKLFIFILALLTILSQTCISFAVVATSNAVSYTFFGSIWNKIVYVVSEVWPFALGFGLIISLILLFKESSKMKTVRINSYAGNYGYDFNLTHSNDIYLHTTTHRVRVEDHKN